MHTRKRKPITVTLDREVVAEARLSERRWRQENRAAVKAYERFFEKHGVWNDGERGW